jgi:hypothetical protein
MPYTGLSVAFASTAIYATMPGKIRTAGFTRLWILVSTGAGAHHGRDIRSWKPKASSKASRNNTKATSEKEVQEISLLTGF